MRCVHCGSELPLAARYCHACGTPAAVAAPGSVTTRDVAGTGIAIGHGASAVVQNGVLGQELEPLFATVLAHIECRPADHEVDKAELARTVTQVEQEAARGEEADLGRLAHLLKVLKAVAPDVLEVTAAALLNPVAGVATAEPR
jgi:zinc-ribbon domain